MKKKYFTLFLLVIIVSVASAQSGVPANLRGDYNKMMANQSMIQFNQLMSRNWMMGYHNNPQVNFKYDFKVTMRDSSTKIVRSKIYGDTANHKSYILLVDKDLKRSDPAREQKIYADQTLSISRVQRDMHGTYAVVGLATDSCWLFETLKGPISAYANVSELADVGDAYLRAFQYGNDKVKPLDPAALEPIIKTDPKAHKLFLKKKYLRAIEKYNDNILEQTKK
ncbi:hypothetical protein [Mucilaginibacter myungsuensis]|uniref:GLPGLI family protein n=1 Tax=Mucilaginibacter myungsuensis TaxID=649104 RepID=A0A929PYH8_9SPHI|nr:hypothetical protein [Mucilaginibacter myungsuensis]MBE9663455.1 hypothetical protein [Mucilaginibacter myungsuensis]MDN3600193.1 hypothetical protein [Mucilaginibacter myungsuensis]